MNENGHEDLNWPRRSFCLPDTSANNAGNGSAVGLGPTCPVLGCHGFCGKSGSMQEQKPRQHCGRDKFVSSQCVRRNGFSLGSIFGHSLGSVALYSGNGSIIAANCLFRAE
jgi:hypothetical protein